MIVKARLVFETEFDCTFIESDEEVSAKSLTDAWFDGGVKQYIKDYNPDFGREYPIEAEYTFESSRGTIDFREKTW